MKLYESIVAGLSSFLDHPEEDVDKCIIHIINKTHQNLSYFDICDILFEYSLEKRPNLNFFYDSYDVSKDIELDPHTSKEEQEYLNRDFKQSFHRRFPKLYENSFVPKSFRTTPYWRMEKIIFDKLKNLENVNWTNQTLSYTRSNIVGKHMVDCIIDELYFMGYNVGIFKGPLTFVDATAGMGGDSITLALYKNSKQVISYEIVESVHKMLKNNINLYGLNEKIITKNKRFDYEIPKDSVIIIDPPYESEYGSTLGNFRLSIDKMPIYAVVQKCLDNGAKCVILTMPKTYKYNVKYALDFDQHVNAFQMGEKNNKIFVIMSLKDGEKLNLTNFASYKIVSDNVKGGKADLYSCRVLKMG